MKFDRLTINGEPVRVCAVIDVVSPFTVGWTESEARAYMEGHATVTMTLPAAKRMHRLLAGLHLPKRLRADWDGSEAP